MKIFRWAQGNHRCSYYKEGREAGESESKKEPGLGKRDEREWSNGRHSAAGFQSKGRSHKLRNADKP